MGTKKILFVILLSIVLAVVFSSKAMAVQIYDDGQVKYSVDASNPTDKFIEITGYVTGQSGVIVIPETFEVNGEILPVKKIKDFAFQNHIDLTSITIPNNIVSIGRNAFYYNISLSEIKFKSGSELQEIGELAFSNTAIESITIPKGVTMIDKSAFYNIPSLNEVIFESGNKLQVIRYATFGNTGLKSITIPKSVTRIDDLAFKNNLLLSKVVFENSDLSISQNLLIFEYGFGKRNIPLKIVGDQFKSDGVTTTDVYQYYMNNKLSENLLFDQIATVNFDANNGSVITSEKIELTEKLTEPTPAPTKSGYIFTGWYEGDQQWDFTNDLIKQNQTTLKAKWTAIEKPVPVYKVTFTSDGGIPEITSQYLSEGRLAVEPTEPTRKGYTFVGWYNGEEKWDFSKNAVRSTTSLKAKWIVDLYKVSFDSKGGNQINDIDVENNTTIIQPKSPIKKGAIFIGWYLNDVEWDFTSNIVQANTQLVAKWRINRYKVTFNVAGGSKVNLQNIDENHFIKLPKKPTRKGYIFEGWYNGKVKWDFTKSTVTKDLNLKAKWILVDVVPAKIQFNKFTLKSKSIVGKTEPYIIVELYRNGEYKKKVRSNSKGNFRLVLKVKHSSKSKFTVRSIDASGNKRTYSLQAK